MVPVSNSGPRQPARIANRGIFKSLHKYVGALCVAALRNHKMTLWTVKRSLLSLSKIIYLVFCVVPT